MCGITGIAGKKDPELLKVMNESLIHRGPDGGGSFIDDTVSLSMRRLKIIDLETGDQPIFNEDKTIVVVYNGEIYNFKELRALCEKNGHTFYTKTDTEVIVHLYEDYGEDCVNYLRGMFAFAVYDAGKKKLLIARDRIGEKPLYYRVNKGILYFGSELKSLLKDSSWQRKINLHAIYLYLKFLYIPAPYTIFQDIYKLSAGHILVWQDFAVSTRLYWKIPFQKRIAAAPEDIIEEIRSLIKESVTMRMVSDVPLGAFLSGGLDSGSVVALMSQASSQKVKTFSIGYEGAYASYNETEYSKKIATHFGCDHEEYIVSPDVIALTRELITHFDEPFADSSAIPTYLVSKMSRHKVTVALSGIGGDELFGGYPRYQGIKLSRRYERIPHGMRWLINWGASYLPESTESRNIPGWIKRFARGGMLPMIDRYLDWVTFDQLFTGRAMYTEEFLSALGNNPLIPQQYFFISCPSQNIFDKIYNFDFCAYVADDLLVIADRMSMAHGLELRVPLCDHKLIEYVASLPEDMRFPGMQKKALLKEAMRSMLPPDIFKRKKQGFMVPLGDWIKGPIQPLVQELLNEKQVARRGIFKPDTVSWILKQHNAGAINGTDQIWTLMNLELWYQTYMD